MNHANGTDRSVDEVADAVAFGGEDDEGGDIFKEKAAIMLVEDGRFYFEKMVIGDPEWGIGDEGEATNGKLAIGDWR